MTFARIDKPLTASQLRARMLEQLALMNGHGAKATKK
jgi:hypothetical protein